MRAGTASLKPARGSRIVYVVSGPVSRPIVVWPASARRRTGVQERGVVVDRYDDDPVDHLPDEEAHHLGLRFGVLARVADDRPVAGLAQAFLDAGDDGRVERGVELGEDHPDGHGAAAPQAARDVVDLIVEVGRGLLDELAVGAKNVAPVVVLGDCRE